MYVGIYDEDIFTESAFRGNMDTMQIAYYHKHHQDIVELITDLNDNLIRFTKIYYVKNVNNKEFNSKFIADSRTECIGLGFTNNKRKPNPLFYDQPADKTIYNKFIRLNYNKTNITNQRRMRMFQKQGHYRFNFIKDNNGEYHTNHTPTETEIVCYDLFPLEESDINFYDQFKKVTFKYPLYVDSFSTAAAWTNRKWYTIANEMIYKGEPTLEEFKEYVNNRILHSKPLTFILNINREPVESKLLFIKWLSRILYAKTRGVRLILRTNETHSKLYYQNIFTNLFNWNNRREFGKTFEIYFKKHSKQFSQIFDFMCEKEYNIDRMVKVNASEYNKQGRTWDYVE